METTNFSEALVPTSKTPRHHIPAACTPAISLQLLVSSNIRSLPRKWHSHVAEEWCKFCSHFHEAHLKGRSLPARKIYFLLTSFSWSCQRRKVFRMTSKSHHDGWIPLTIKKAGRQHCEDSKSCSCNFCHLRASKKFKRGLRLSELYIVLSALPWT
jgi:hypothetical protein